MQQAVQGHRSGPLNWLGKDLGQEYGRDLGSGTNTVALEDSSKIQKAKPEEQRLEAIK